ncbi:MAG: DNA-processing protein DprA, partial [Paracoccus sp. (in: a-proteobacteria)]|nr:DNA-processing protein DprA [Paracoccus sp. (in: a-proteobacteria)]
MIAEHGSAAAALEALPEIARRAGISDYAPCPEAEAEAELRAGARAHARLIRIDAPDYPALLREIADAPPVIWVKGNAGALQRPMLAVIGARDASSLGRRMARGLAGAMAAMGVSVVAGLARGIDTAAHEASVKHGTVAVMAGGVDQIYPSENRLLAAQICDRGCLISEQPPGLAPVARHFPMRNRIISGLGHGVVVVEAAVKSGSLITARAALDQGREVLAVPGHPVDGRAGGCNQLLRDGALLVRHSDDILEAIPALAAPAYPAEPDPAGQGDPPFAAGHHGNHGAAGPVHHPPRPAISAPDQPGSGLARTAPANTAPFNRAPEPARAGSRGHDDAPGSAQPAKACPRAFAA